MYPYVIPFSGAAMSADASLLPQTVFAHQEVAGTDIAWDQAAKILPVDPDVREAILAIEATFEERLASLEARVAHLPSRVRSLLWVVCSIPVLNGFGRRMPAQEDAEAQLFARLPGLADGDGASLRDSFRDSWQGAAVA